MKNTTSYESPKTGDIAITHRCGHIQYHWVGRLNGCTNKSDAEIRAELTHLASCDCSTCFSLAKDKEDAEFCEKWGSERRTVTLRLRVVSGGGADIFASEQLPADGSEITSLWTYDPDQKSSGGRLNLTAGKVIFGQQRGGSYGFHAGEPVESGRFPLEIFRPNPLTLSEKRLRLAGVGGLNGVPIAPYESDDFSIPKVGEVLAVYPSPYYGNFNTPQLCVIEVV